MNAENLRHFGDAYRSSRATAERARDDLRAAIREAVKTMSESEITRVTGVTRMTVRKALGK